MTDPWTDPWQELDRFTSDGGRLAQPASIDEVRRLARRRRRFQVVAVGVAVVVIAGGVSVGIGYGDDLRRADPGPATQHTTIPGPTSTPSSPRSPTSRSTPSTPSSSAAPSGPTTPTTSMPTGAPPGHARRYDDIPTSYPWLSFVEDLGGDGYIEGPGEQVEPPDPLPCEQETWAPQRLIRQITVSTHFPEFSQSRQIVIFLDAAAAQRALERVRSAFSRCPIERYREGLNTRYVISPTAGGPTPPGSGHADAWLAVSAREQYRQYPKPGLTEMRWIRLSNAVIYTSDFGEAESDDPRKGHEADHRITRMLSTWCRLAGGC